jgi:hypothetical protein
MSGKGGSLFMRQGVEGEGGAVAGLEVVSFAGSD